MVAWEKIAVWVLALIVLLVIIFFIVRELGVNNDGIIGSFFDMLSNAPKDAAPQ